MNCQPIKTFKVPQERLLCSTHVDNKKNRFSKIFVLSVLHVQTSCARGRQWCGIFNYSFNKTDTVTLLLQTGFLFAFPQINFNTTTGV